MMCKKIFFLLIIALGSMTIAKAQIPACSTYIFTPFSEPFTYLSTGNSVNLQSDDVTVRYIPIGFTFSFCGVNYTQLSACSNGWLSFSNSSSTQYTNSLSNANTMKPVLMPMWDDLHGGYGGSSKYYTSGTAPNRVFTFEWRNFRPLSYTSNPQASFQVKLYESGGAIEFRYKRESGTNPLPSCSMGILNSTTDYQSLKTTTSSPLIYSTTFTTNITTYPATNQVYRWDPPVPCDMITALTLGAYNSTAASFSWTGVSGALGYDFAVDTNPALAPSGSSTIYTTTTTSGMVTGLTPSTIHYIHVRTRCSAFGVSQWDTIMFQTLPPCSKPSGIVFSNIDSNSANFQWALAGNVVQYQYAVSLNKNAPLSGNPNVLTTTTPFVALPDTLQEGTLYYVHIRAKCVANDSSVWALDSFRTPIPCRRPVLSLTHLSQGNSITSWPHVLTAVKYEYYLGPLTSLPASGTPILNNFIQTPYLVPSTSYTMSVRCLCEYYGVNSVSSWSSIDFTTPSATLVQGVINDAMVTVYPNPARDVITIDIPKIAIDNKPEISIIDINGRIVKSLNISSEKMNINVSELVPGIYMLKYKDSKGVKPIKITIE